VGEKKLQTRGLERRNDEFVRYVHSKLEFS
jgi:hypothetical protein